MEQEWKKMEEQLDDIARRMEERHEIFKKLPKYQQLYHRTSFIVIPPFFKMKWRIERWYDRKQSPYSNARDLR